MANSANALASKLYWHPKHNERGQRVAIHRPNQPSPLVAWSDSLQTASVVPDGPLPCSLNGVSLAPWDRPPQDQSGWEDLARACPIDEPEFHHPSGCYSAAGVVVVESDGRLWLVCPTNQFAGYEMTFPKGRLDGKSLQATALAEAYEESGLYVRLLRHLTDVTRTVTRTRYYLAERIGGSPAAMGWESQSVVLVPRASWSSLKLMPPDQLVLAALKAAL